MSDREEWGPVVSHDGMKRPVPNGTYIRAYLRGGAVVEAITGRHGVLPDGSLVQGHVGDAWIWGTNPGMEAAEVIQYQVRSPRALHQLREMIETLPAPSRQKEDA